MRHLYDSLRACAKEEEVKALNPQYRTGLVPGDSHACTLRLPTLAMTAFVQLGDSIYNYRATELLTNRREVEVAQVQTKSSRRGRAARGSKTVTVRRGDTLGAIAKRNGTSVSRLRQLNGIKGNNIKAGQRIIVR